MALRLTARLRDDIMKYGSLASLMSNCFWKYYTGSQPATAEAAPTGTLLVVLSNASGTPTREVLSQGSVTFSGTVSGATCTGITVNSLQIMSGTVTDATTVLADFATAVAANINNNPKNLLFKASASAGVVTITARPGLGTLPNGWVVTSSVTTISKSDVNMGSTTAGVTALNGLNWGVPTAGGLPKLSTQTWSGISVAGGTAGWFRIEAAVADAGGIDSTESIYRIDGAIATSGGELNMGNTTITISTTQTLSDYTLTLPTA